MTTASMAILYSLLSMLQSVILGTERVPVDNGWARFNFQLSPPNITNLIVHKHRWVVINCSNVDLQSDGAEKFNASNIYIVSIVSQNSHVAIPFSDQDLFMNDNRTDIIYLLPRSDQLIKFGVKAVHIGKTVISIKVHDISFAISNFANSKGNLDVRDMIFNIDIEELESDDSYTNAQLDYQVSVIRKLRVVDMGFNCVIIVIAMLNSFGMGCLTDWASVRMHLIHPTSLLLTAACQFVLLPMLSLGIVQVLFLGKDVGLGLFYTTCLPAGGGGHVMVSVTHSDRSLSISINFMCTFLAMGSVPLWVLSTRQLLGSPSTDFLHQLYHLELWLASSAGAYLLGLALRLCSREIAEGYLNWFAKPFLLLISILLITLGVYINIYVFNTLSLTTMIAAACVPLIGYVTGFTVAYVCRQEADYIKTIATETTISNCLLVLVLIRFSFEQPSADLASAIPIFILFSSPGPFVLASILGTIKRSIQRKCEKRREKKYRTFSIVSSLLNVTNVTSLSALQSPNLCSPVDDATSVLVDEKVTVL